jgi:hypothetical protein
VLACFGFCRAKSRQLKSSLVLRKLTHMVHSINPLWVDGN